MTKGEGSKGTSGSTGTTGQSHGGSGGKAASGSQGGMDKSAASRIQSSGAQNPSGPTHASGFDVRAQAAADKK